MKRTTLSACSVCGDRPTYMFAGTKNRIELCLNCLATAVDAFAEDGYDVGGKKFEARRR